MKTFKIDIADGQIEDLKIRLRNVRWPSSIFQIGDEDGVDLQLVRRLATYWQQTFDWRAQEARLNELPQFVAHIDGYDIHFIYKRDAARLCKVSERTPNAAAILGRTRV